MLLSLQGQQTEVAYTGKEALRRLPSFKPDIVLLDLGPEMESRLSSARRAISRTSVLVSRE